MADAVRRSLSAGDIQLGFEDARRRICWPAPRPPAALPRTEDDSLMLVDANLRGSKANLETTKQVACRGGRPR